MNRVAWLVLWFGCGARAPVAEVYVAPSPPNVVTPVVRAPEKSRVWPDEQTITSEDGAFKLRYPASTFIKARAMGPSILLTSDVLEAGMRGDDIVFRVLLTKLDNPPVMEIAKVLDGDAFRHAFPPSGTFVATEGFVDEHRGANGARGYLVQMGVEGNGEHIYALTTNDGASWRFECHYCCGMIDKPKMTSDAQLESCRALLTTFERDRP